MNKLKKMVAFLMACVCFIVCAVPAMEVSAANAYTFKSKGVEVAPGGDASSFIKANKSFYVSMKNGKSCVASSGFDVTRKYKYFTLVTYSKTKNGEGKVESITFTNSQVKTVEGAHCGMKTADLKKIYKTAKKFGSTYYVMKGNTKLSFIMKGDKVSQITYTYTGKF